jgi:hypothetical protein
MLVVASSCLGCPPTVTGTYGEGAAKIELKSGGKASFNFMGQSQECTYTTAGKKITMDCKDGTPIEMTISDDGKTLNMPSGMSLKKQ